MSLLKNWDLQIDPDVFKITSKLPRSDAKRIIEVIYLLPSDPYCGDIEKMKGKDNSWRRRVGSYRIFYKLLAQEKIILVFRFERRTSKTY